ncbi:hypothetical protein SBF1_2820009 [Candidatus Desulfosporosinus infrequens]|uniref:Uncharacterized protein n=1 Tax=Candidatus Desulfosporosinus infrequens TaxID=2043169 RepID=A0A2U3KUL1_9FIRM|nr:hypothetical protein SBF1_2820009 [Candidatus Desulfosporosinus infrequens]
MIWAHSSAVEPPAHNGLVLGSNPSGPTSSKFEARSSNRWKRRETLDTK